MAKYVVTWKEMRSGTEDRSFEMDDKYELVGSSYTSGVLTLVWKEVEIQEPNVYVEGEL